MQPTTNYQNITVVDIEKQPAAEPNVMSMATTAAEAAAAASAATADENPNDYVYDLYLPDSGQNGEIDYNFVENLLRFVYNGHFFVSTTMI